MPIIYAVIIGLVLALAGAIVSVILITPEKKRESFKNNKFMLFIHDLFNFRFLVLEKILKFFYILNTLACILVGFFMLFAGRFNYSYYFDIRSFSSYAGYGLLVMIVGPIVVRIIYEGMMMFILLVKNTMQINNRLSDNNNTNNHNNGSNNQNNNNDDDHMTTLL